MLLKQVILKKNGNILKEKNICVVIQVERGINPNLFYCWDEVNGLGEWMDRTQIKILGGEKKPKVKKKKNPLKTAEDFLIG